MPEMLQGSLRRGRENEEGEAREEVDQPRSAITGPGPKGLRPLLVVGASLLRQKSERKNAYMYSPQYKCNRKPK